MHRILAFFGLCLLLTGCGEDNVAISLDKNTLPLKSKIVIDGIHGCVAASPYVVTISQKGSDVSLTLKSFETIIDRQSVSLDDFKELWAACCDGDIGSLKKSYGKDKTTADFRGKFHVDIKTKEGKLSREANLTYGVIVNEQFNDIINKIMEILPAEHQLPEYSATLIDSSTMPLKSKFEIEGSWGCLARQDYKVAIVQEANIVTFSSKVSGYELVNQPVDYEKFRELWAAYIAVKSKPLRGNYVDGGRTTASFIGFLTCEALFENKDSVKEEYGVLQQINDERYAVFLDKMMEALPPEAHLPFYSIKTIDYSRYPKEVWFYIQRKLHDQTLQDYGSIHLEFEKAIDCYVSFYIVREDKRDHKELTTDEFREFWKECSVIDLVSLKDSYGNDQDSSAIQWELGISLKTPDGNFYKDIKFPNDEISDSKLSKLLDLIGKLSGDALEIPLNKEQTQM